MERQILSMEVLEDQNAQIKGLQRQFSKQKSKFKGKSPKILEGEYLYLCKILEITQKARILMSTFDEDWYNMKSFHFHEKDIVDYFGYLNFGSLFNKDETGIKFFIKAEAYLQADKKAIEKELGLDKLPPTRKTLGNSNLVLNQQ